MYFESLVALTMKITKYITECYTLYGGRERGGGGKRKKERGGGGKRKRERGGDGKREKERGGIANNNMTL